jgi:hypothetical protein
VNSVETSESTAIPRIITGGIPDDIYSGYVWEMSEAEELALIISNDQKNEQIAEIVDTFNSHTSENKSSESITENEPLTNAFTAVVSNAESLRYFFFGAAEKADSYAWNFGDGFDGQGQSIAHEFTEEGSYTVKYLVSRGEEVMVEEKTIEVYRPAKLSPVTAFAPGFDGKNDVFDVLYNARNITEVVNFEITDANGRKVYQSGGQSVWDGKNLNGELCQPGNFYWLLEYKDRQGNLKSQAGSIRIFAE